MINRMPETSKTPNDDESPGTTAKRLVEMEREAGWLLAWIHDLEISYHDRVGPELAKLTDDLKWVRSRQSAGETADREVEPVGSGTELDGIEPHREAVEAEPVTESAPQLFVGDLGLEHELRRVKNSFSWRSTAPLRFVRHRVMRLLGRS